jgi:molybdopterin-containing oxidoreductase family iron-sulfur binding subunit
MAADERIPLRRSQVRTLAAALLDELAAIRREGAGPEAPRRAAATPAPDRLRAWARAVARDLFAHAGASLLVTGDAQPPEVHAFVHAANELLGNVGATVTYGASPVFEAGEASHGPGGLLAALEAGEVGTLVIVGGNPVYTAGADRDLARSLPGVATTAYVGSHLNETARACEWFVPEAHFLETWGDARAADGTPSIVQPLIAPLGDGWTAAQVLAALDGFGSATARDLVQAYWRTQTGEDFEAEGQGALVRGVGPGASGFAADPSARVDWSTVARELAAAPPPPAPMEIAYYADARVLDGRFADNAWLAELPDPVTKLTWDNAALLSPGAAARLGVNTSDVVSLDVRGRALLAPVIVVPGMADDVVGIALGYGQASPGRLPDGVGANAFALRDSHAPWFDAATVRATGRSHRLARTQEHESMEGRPIVLHATLGAYRSDPAFAARRNTEPRSLYRLAPNAPTQWAMTIDLNACTGCSACVVACVAENNVPVVGKSGVLLRREMHWLRIDRYFSGEAASPPVVVQPMLCQHCEAAPCEYVCPVNATVHSPDGLNEMVYNRCVGTRFCSNNCPYKVRRFNFFNYNVDKPDTERLAMNPDVTVRARGVMEKCTYCVQRIRQAEIRARREHRAIHDGEVVTACQQTCPTGAIVFGDVADPTTKVSRSWTNDRLYQVLHELGTVPRTRYLARITNPNPELAGA